MLLRDLLLEKLFSVPEGADADIRNTAFFNILSVNPSLAKSYVTFLRRDTSDSGSIGDSEIRSRNFVDPDRSRENDKKLEVGKGPNSMATKQRTRICTHIKVNGLPCGSPALRGEVFCYFHQRMIRGVPTPPNSRIHPIAILEDEASIQASLMEIINALVRNHIDVGRARLILRALYIAARNSRRANFQPYYSRVVTEVPEYPAAPPSGPFALAAIQAEALAYINTPQEEESEDERLNAYFNKPAETQQRKPPVRAKKAARARRPRTAAKRENGNRPQQPCRWKRARKSASPSRVGSGTC